MMRFLKLTLFISILITSLRVSAGKADTLKNLKYITFEASYGIPVYNQLTIDGSYKVNSKPKSYFNLCFGIVRKNSNILFGFSLIQSEFSGKEYSLGAGVIPYKGTRYPYYYNMYQHINYNVYYLNIGYGYDFHIDKRSTITPILQLSVPLVYSFKIDNIYSKNQSYDTLLFNASKNSWNNDTNFGRIPRLNIGVAYKYQVLSRLSITAELNILYALTYDRKNPETMNYDSAYNHSDNYSFLAYDISKQIAIIPSIGINIKLN